MRSTIDRIVELRTTRRLWIGGLITSWFWLAGIVALSLLPTLIKGHLGGGKELITLGLCVFTLGIAFGSYLAARASRRRPNLALVPVGALLMGAVAEWTGPRWPVGMGAVLTFCALAWIARRRRSMAAALEGPASAPAR